MPSHQYLWHISRKLDCFQNLNNIHSLTSEDQNNHTMLSSRWFWWNGVQNGRYYSHTMLSFIWYLGAVLIQSTYIKRPRQCIFFLFKPLPCWVRGGTGGRVWGWRLGPGTSPGTCLSLRPPHESPSLYTHIITINRWPWQSCICSLYTHTVTIDTFQSLIYIFTIWNMTVHIKSFILNALLSFRW